MAYVLEWGGATVAAPPLFTSLAHDVARNAASVTFEIIEADSVQRVIATADLHTWITAGLALVEAQRASGLHVSVASPRRVSLRLDLVRRGDASWWAASLESADEWPSIGYVRAKELALDYVVLSVDDGPPDLDDADADSIPWDWPFVVVAAKRASDGTWDERLGEAASSNTLADLQRAFREDYAAIIAAARTRLRDAES